MSANRKFRMLCRVVILLILAGAIGIVAGQSDDNDENFGLASLGAVHCQTERSHSEQNRIAIGSEAQVSQHAEFFLSERSTASGFSVPINSPSLVIPLRT